MVNLSTVIQPRDRKRGDARTCDVAIVGAGPYGLVARAQLRSSDLNVRHFGVPMSFWRDRMPAGMLMRSPWVATNFLGGDSGLTLDDYERSLGETFTRPLPLEHFIGYGEWFRKRTSPDLDERSVDRVAAAHGGFELTLADGEQLHARRVVVAAGIEPFAARPLVFGGLPRALAMHSTDLTDPAALAGSKVAVVGAGQSALESAALLHEAGAEVEVLVRAPRVFWLGRSTRLHSLGPLTKLMYAPADVGPAGLSRLVAMPTTFGCFPRRPRERLGKRAIRPAGSGWLVPRLSDVRITTGAEVESARPHHSGACLRLTSGEKRVVQHVVLGTGFRVDVLRYAFLAPDLTATLRCVNGYPVLSRSFESSIAGLHFLGAPAAGTFGPFFRFVAGAEFAATRLSRHLLGSKHEAAHVATPALESA